MGPVRRRALGRKPLVPSKRVLGKRRGKRACRLGRGIGRWLKPRMRRR